MTGTAASDVTVTDFADTVAETSATALLDDTAAVSSPVSIASASPTWRATVDFAEAELADLDALASPDAAEEV